MNFLVVGDSWGCGEWDKDCTHNPHRGLEQYLTEDGHRVTNLSNLGISNHDIYQRIETYFRRNPEHDIDAVFVFQTEWTRDYKHSSGWDNALQANDWNEIKTAEDLGMRWISRFYRNLSEISAKVGCKVYVIGGASDALWLDNIEDHYPGCIVVCQSMTNLIINGDHRISTPVFSWYEQRAAELVQQLKTKLTQQELSNLLTLIDLGYQREVLLRENPGYFYPDGVHPNRQGIRILYDFLKQKYF